MFQYRLSRCHRPFIHLPLIQSSASASASASVSLAHIVNRRSHTIGAAASASSCSILHHNNSNSSSVSSLHSFPHISSISSSSVGFSQFPRHSSSSTGKYQPPPLLKKKKSINQNKKKFIFPSSTADAATDATEPVSAVPVTESAAADLKHDSQNSTVIKHDNSVDSTNNSSLSEPSESISSASVSDPTVGNENPDNENITVTAHDSAAVDADDSTGIDEFSNEEIRLTAVVKEQLEEQEKLLSAAEAAGNSSAPSSAASRSNSSSNSSGGRESSNFFSLSSPPIVPAIVIPFGRPMFPSAQYIIQRIPRVYLPAIAKMKSPVFVGIFMMKQNETHPAQAAAAADSDNGEPPIKKSFVDYINPVGILAEVYLSNGVINTHRRISISSLLNPVSPGASASPYEQPNLSSPVLVNLHHHVDPLIISRKKKSSKTDSLTSNGHLEEENSSIQQSQSTIENSNEMNAMKQTEILNPKEIRSLMTSIRSKLDLIKITEGPQFALRHTNSTNFFNAGSDSDPGQFADCAAVQTLANPVELNRVISAISVVDRLSVVSELLSTDLETLDLQLKIRAELAEEAKRNETEKKFLQAKKKELDAVLGAGKGSKDSFMEKFSRRLTGKTISPEVQKVLDEELNKFMSVDADTGEFSVVRDYLDWLTSIPHGVHSEDNKDLIKAQKLLDDEHYGMDSVKERILEFIATSILSGNINSAKILCLIGPPGVGKTSIASSIARSLERKFSRFSVGGLDDVNEIKGHRRTFVGAMPGKLIKCLKKCETANPVILIDEIDKLQRSNRGDPASALLEVLDPEQNKNFVDHYIDVPIDMSRVLFVCTANERSRIPTALADRMEFIECTGYMESEKFHIAKRYLENSEREKLGLKEENVKISDEAIRKLINLYSREPGVRNLKKFISKIYGKVALKVAREREIQELELEIAQTKAAIAELVNSNSNIDTNNATNPTTTTIATEVMQHSTVDPIIQPPAADSFHSSPFPIEQTIIGPDDLIDYCGLPRFSNELMFPADRPLPVGVAQALAWSEMGGSTLFIECTAMDQPVAITAVDAKPLTKSKRGRKPKIQKEEENKFDEDGDEEESANSMILGGLQVTGNIGDVMRESVSIAYTVAKRQLFLVSPHNSFFHDKKIHLHWPSGATPKDGPSAGITIVCALMSLATGQSIQVSPAAIKKNPDQLSHSLSSSPPRLAMTGELSLTGRVLPIGGVKEKLLAAKRAGVTDVILPSENRKDYEELNVDIRNGIRIHFATHFEEVREIAFPELKTRISVEYTDKSFNNNNNLLLNNNSSSSSSSISSSMGIPSTNNNNQSATVTAKGNGN